MFWRREGDSVRDRLNAIGNLQIPHCRAYRGCQRCHGSLPDIARQKLVFLASKKDIAHDAKRFTSRLKCKYARRIPIDAKGFKKCVVSLVRRGLPHYAGMPSEAANTLAPELLTKALPWKNIYPRCIPGHERLHL